MIQKFYAVLLFMCPSAYATATTKVYLEPAKSSGSEANQDLTEIVDDLLKQELLDFEELELSQISEDSHWKIFPKLIATRDRYVLSLKLVNLRDGGSFNEYSYMNSIDELNETVPALVDKSLVKLDIESQNTSVIEAEVKVNPGERASPESFWYLGMGPASPSGIKNRQSMSQWTFGYGWFYNNQILRLELETASPHNSEDYSLSGWGFTGMHLLNKGRTSFFMSGTLHRADFTYQDDVQREHEIDSYIAGGGVGVLFWTSSTKLIEFSLYTRTFLAKVDGATPNIAGLKVGLFW